VLDVPTRPTRSSNESTISCRARNLGPSSSSCMALSPPARTGPPAVAAGTSWCPAARRVILRFRFHRRRHSTAQGSWPAIADVAGPGFGPDAGDRHPGFSGYGFIGELRELLRQERLDKNDGVAVLAACDEGQMNWRWRAKAVRCLAITSPRALHDQLASRWFDVKELLAYVKPRVAHWVHEHRGQAVQTPVLLGNPGLGIRLSRSLGPREAPLPEQRKEEDKLFDEWNERQRLISRSPLPPYRHAPVAWRLYQEALLRAERLLRAGDGDSVRAVLEAKGYREKLQTRIEGPKLADPWSLALFRKTAGASDRTRALEADTYEKAIEGQLAERRAERAPGEPSGAAKAEPAKEVPAGAAKAKAMARPPSTGLSSLAILAVDGDHSRPKFVEGQLPVWYDEFARRGERRRSGSPSASACSARPSTSARRPSRWPPSTLASFPGSAR